MSAKAKGARNEHRSIRLLEAAGYACAPVAASLGAWEAETLILFAAPPNCRKLLHRWRDRKRLPDVLEI